MNQELPDVQAGFRKERGTRDQIANICWIIAFDCVDHNKLRKALKRGREYHFTCLLRKLYVGQETTVRLLYGTTNWFKIEKGV